MDISRLVSKIRERNSAEIDGELELLCLSCTKCAYSQFNTTFAKYIDLEAFNAIFYTIVNSHELLFII